MSEREKQPLGRAGRHRGATFSVDPTKDRRVVRERWTPLDGDGGDLRPRAIPERAPSSPEAPPGQTDAEPGGEEGLVPVGKEETSALPC